MDYIPAKDADFRTWAENYAANLSADPAKFFMTAGEALSVQNAVDDFVEKLAIATNEYTRTKVTVAEKSDARSVAETLCRQYAILIKDNLGISDADKLAIGVRPINPDREPIDPPTTEPLLNILGNTPGTQTLRYADSSTPDKRARPFGAAGLELYLAVADVDAAPLSEAKSIGLFTRNPIDVSFTDANNTKIATYYARWYNAKGEFGPWSLPVSMTIAA